LSIRHAGPSGSSEGKAAGRQRNRRDARSQISPRQAEPASAGWRE